MKQNKTKIKNTNFYKKLDKKATDKANTIKFKQVRSFKASYLLDSLKSD